MTKNPQAFLFANGNAAFFDKQGNQLGKMQYHGWMGLHLFIKEYPHATVSMQQYDDIDHEMLTYLLKSIKKPKE